jgi:hypothetical protein
MTLRWIAIIVVVVLEEVVKAGFDDLVQGFKNLYFPLQEKARFELWKRLAIRGGGDRHSR